MISSTPTRRAILWPVALAIPLLIFGCGGTTVPPTQTGRQDVSAQQLEAMMADGQPLRIADVRTPAEYAGGHIPGAVNLPLDDIVTWAPTLDPLERVCAVCAAGGRSTQAADSLAAQGLVQVYNLVGGMNAWTGPVEF